MAQFDGSGALGWLGDNPIPQGTLDELRKVGVDPGKIASCAPESPGVRGCPVWRDCPFHQTALGGFKGHGPRNVGYYLRTHEGNQKQDTTTCHAFTRNLLSRMRTGNQQRAEGKTHEIVRVIAQEGQTVRMRVGVPVDPNNHNINAKYEMRTETVVVPKHPRPGEISKLSYEAELWEEEQIRRKYDPEFQTGLPEEASIPDQPEAFGADDGVLDMEVVAVPVVAEPVAGGKKGK